MDKNNILFVNLIENKSNSRLYNILKFGFDDKKCTFIETLEEFIAYTVNVNQNIEKCDFNFLIKVIFAIELNDGGLNPEYLRFLHAFRSKSIDLSNYVAGIIVDGKGELYTKSIGREFVFAANYCGCRFPGRPLVEATGSLHNFNIQANNLNTDVLSAYRIEVCNLVKRINDFSAINRENPKLLVLHSAKESQSNTYTLWSIVKEKLKNKGIIIQEISLRNGTLQDCGACTYETCLHYGENDSCFYGGTMVKEVYPALKKCDGLLLICPNYNDSVSAHIMAVINRMTALYRKVPFWDKELFAIIVSGYSGSDILAEQLISSLNMNKAFRLPGNFAYMETANNRGEARAIEGIEEKMSSFADIVERTLKGDKN